VPASLELQREYGSDLQVLFVECQGAESDKAEAFAWRQRWMDTSAMWSTERPVQVEGNGLPKFALLDVEGRLLLSGNPLAMKKKIEEAIAEQVAKAKSAPEGTPAKLAKTWSSFAKGEIGAALAACDKLAATDATLTAAAGELRAAMVARTESRIARGGWLIDNGYIDEGIDLLGALSKSVEGEEELELAVAAELVRVLPAEKTVAEGFRAEVEASKALASLLDKIREKPFEDGSVKALAKLAQKHAGTKSGARAAHMVELAKIKP
jgi:hypothetical protein